jgi:DNA-binding NarL/FixJ family response regulator
MPRCYDPLKVAKTGHLAGMATKAEIAQRRRQVQALWLHGASTGAIAERLNTPDRTVRRDVAAIGEELRATYTAELHTQLARTVAHLRAVQGEAWRLLEELRRSKDVAKVAAAQM